MSSYQLTQIPVATTGMLIRKPVAEVFEAFMDPVITTQFWFTKSSGRLAADQQIQWDWEMYDASVQVYVKAIEPNKRIFVEWGEAGARTTIEWIFTSLTDATTFVAITNAGFSGDGDALVKQAIDATEGFSLLLAGLKAFLEHNVRLNLVLDRFPAGLANTQ